MKANYSLRLISGFLFSSALLFTSCAKEGLQEIKEQKDNTGLQLQEQVATANTGSVISNYVPGKATGTWIASGGSMVTQGQQITFWARTVAGNESSLHMELYCSKPVNGVYPTLVFLASAWGNKYEVALTTAAAPGIKYYVKLSHVSGWVGWPVTMELGVNYLITITGTSVKVAIGVYPA